MQVSGEDANSAKASMTQSSQGAINHGPAREIIVFGASTGGVEAILQIAAGLPAAVLVVIHVPPHGISHLPDVISREGRISVAPPALVLEGREAPLNEYHLQLDDREWVVLHAGVVLTYDDELAFLRTQRQHTP